MSEVPHLNPEPSLDPGAQTDPALQPTERWRRRCVRCQKPATHEVSKSLRLGQRVVTFYCDEHFEEGEGL